MKATFPILLCLLFLFACQSDSKTTEESTTTIPSTTTSQPGENESNVKAAPIDYKALSAAYCKCAEHTVSINKKMKALSDSKDNAAFDAMLPEANKAFKDAMECCREAKFEQTTGKVDQKKLFKPLKESCPNLPDQLMLKMVTEIK